MEKFFLLDMNQDERVAAVAAAIKRVNATPDHEEDVPLAKGLVLHMHVAENCDTGYDEDGEEDESQLEPYQKENGGAAGLYFAVNDLDGEDMDMGGGQFDCLTNENCELPDDAARSNAEAILEELDFDAIAVNGVGEKRFVVTLKEGELALLKWLAQGEKDKTMADAQKAENDGEDEAAKELRADNAEASGAVFALAIAKEC